MARFGGFVGPSYTDRAKQADSENSQNLYVERVESPSGDTKADFVLISKPGLGNFATLTAPPVPALTPPPGVTITSTAMNVTCTFTTPSGNTSGSPIAYASTQVPWGGPCGYLSFNNYLPNSAPTPNPIGWTTPSGFNTVLSLYIQTDATVAPVPPHQLAVYDITLQINYSNGATAFMRPATWQVLSSNPGYPAGGLNGISGSVLNPQNAMDGSTSTFATILGNSFTYPASFSPILQVTNFQLVSSTGSLPIDPNSPTFSGVRALAELNGRAFAVGTAGPNNYFYEIKADGTVINYPVLSGASASPTLAGDTRPQMVVSQTQVLVLSGGIGYVFNLASNTLTLITAGGWPVGATKITFIDGYFIALEPNSQRFAISGINNATSWNPLDFGSASGQPGNIVTMISDHRQLWLLGVNHGEIYYNSGNANFPFSRLEGAFMQQGCAAVDSIALFDNSIIWLGQNENGAGMVWRANGYTPQRISTHAVEAAIQSYPRIDDARSVVYQDGGHTFYMLTFPSANDGRGASWVYDAATGFWHERNYWNSSEGQAYADKVHCHMYAFTKHLVGDETGTIYQMSQSFMTDAGNPIRRVRTAPDLANGGEWTYYNELRLLTETGVGLDGGVIPGTDPQIILQVSNDGGRTWGNELSISLGKIGEYKKLVRWRRLGRSRNRAFRVICSEPVFVALIAADLDAQ